ncbi:MAG: D-2-hydroxyacid dehydrogenase [Oscillospiraceae bacterium]|nr:D-2-hydroxyacid dehydrogenase [Oscillospiraceae bacterium]MBQ5339819.1 D-2-hydroxyacid dehydrogenase [Oscillospiraceae bacterium]
MRAKRIAILDWDTMAYNKDEVNARRFAALAENVDVYPSTKPEETVQHIGDADVVICNKVLITREVMKACPNIRYIGILATGYNNVDIEAATERGIPVCNAGSYSTDAVTQLVFAYIFDYFQRVALYAMDVRLGVWETAPAFSYFPYPTGELRGKTLGIIGYGNIGKNVAKIAEAFGMSVLIATRTLPQVCPYPVVTAEEVFRRADVLTLHCPLTEQTKGLINKQTLALMKETAILINTSRGGTVVEADLADALNHDMLAGAYLDVLEKEPMSPDTPLKGAKNCVITPHIGWTPLDTRKRLLDITEDNLRGWLGGNPQHVVNGVTAD